MLLKTRQADSARSPFTQNTSTAMPSVTESPKRLYLFGYPVAHSASPAFQNECFKNLGIPHHFTTWSTSKIDKQMLDEIRSDESGGAASVVAVSCV